MNGGYWFLTKLEFESKQNFQNNLLCGFRYSGENEAKVAEIYTPHPVTISSYQIQNPSDVESISTGLGELDFIKKVLVYSPKNFEIEQIQIPNYEYLTTDQSNIRSAIINLIASNNHVNFKRLPKTRFQIGSFNRVLRRQLELQDRKVYFDPNLEFALTKKDDLTSIQRTLEYEINKLSLEYKPHLILQNLFSFFLTQKSDKDVLVRYLTDKRRSKSLDQLNLEFIIENGNEILENVRTIKQAISRVDPLNHTIPDQENLDYRIVLNYTGDKTANQLLGVRGIYFTDKRLSLDEFKKQTLIILDLEKPLWKWKLEKPLLESREDLLKLRKIKAENAAEIQDSIDTIERLLTVDVGGYEVKLFDKKYDATISNYVLVKILPDGTRVKEYHKIRNVPEESQDKVLNNFPVLSHDNERTLVNEVVNSIKSSKPYVANAYNAPYDTIQSREAMTDLKLGKFDIGAKGKNPKRPVVRKIYQRVDLPSVEIFDPYRLFVNFHPYEESHKLAAFVNLLRKSNSRDDGFRKVSTHEELRELKIMAMHGDKEADDKLDFYTTADGDVLDLDYGYYLKTLFLVKELVPHLTITEIMFSPKVAMKELHEKLFYERYHTERFFGYQTKIREDEEKIFKKHFEILKRKLLKRNNVKFISNEGQELLQVYLPLELLLKDVLISLYPPWKIYFNNLEQESIKKHGMLQYPNKFLHEILLDDYFYAKEKNTYKRHFRVRNLNQESVRQELVQLTDKLIESQKIKLFNSYNTSYENLRNLYRSVYIKFPKELRAMIRSNPIHLEDDLVEEDIIFGEKSMFAIDNQDLMKTSRIPDTFYKFLDKETITLLKRYNSTFETFFELSVKLENIVDQSTVINTGLSRENLIYLLNQRRRIIKRRDLFLLYYLLDPESFDSVFLNAFDSIANELNTSGINVIESARDYLYLDRPLPGNSVLIPLRFTKLDKPKVNDEDQISLFEMPQDNLA